ncbi:MAG: hypothetical protein KAU07_03370 [Candidatus Andersenbacteria bacterium]|nr:hypothetical protein [Candidatus Andersenbacteria bacterium]MCK4592718.1 hypothetical protein [Candidatus Parcubacteria bacterium]
MKTKTWLVLIVGILITILILPTEVRDGNDNPVPGAANDIHLSIILIYIYASSLILLHKNSEVDKMTKNYNTSYSNRKCN